MAWEVPYAAMFTGTNGQVAKPCRMVLGSFIIQLRMVFFSTAKRRNGMGLIDRKREDTSLMTIALSVMVTNIFGTFKLAVEEIEKENKLLEKKKWNQACQESNLTKKGLLSRH